MGICTTTTRDDHEDTLASMASLGNLYKQQRKYAEAEELLTEALAARRRQQGDDHPDTLTSMNNLGMLYKQQGKYTEAEELLTEALAGSRKQLGDDQPETLNTPAEGNLGVVRIRQGGTAHAEGAAAVASVLARLQAPPHALPETHAWVVKFRAALAP